MDRTEPALRPLAPGPLCLLRRGELEVSVAPQAGGRLAQLRHRGRDWLVGPDDGHPGAISWGAYPMLPWAGRLRAGRFRFRGRDYALPPNLGPHAIHGLGFARPWRVESQQADALGLGLLLDEDARWPFGGKVRQDIHLDERAVHLRLSLEAGAQAMPRPVLGWHPWFRKLARFEFRPQAYYPRDAEGIATLPLSPPPGPRDDCYLSAGPVRIECAGQGLELRSDGGHWVYYDETPHATCFEPQSGPPDAFNLYPDEALEPGESVHLQFQLRFD